MPPASCGTCERLADDAVRACYAALDMQAAIRRRYAEKVRRTHGVELQIRVGLSSGEVVVRTIRGHEAWVHRLLGEVVSHHHSPDVAAAEAHYATSAALALELGMRPLVAHCRFSLGKLYRRAGDRRAAEHLMTGMSLFHEMGVRFWFEKAEAEMQALEVAGVPA